MQLAALPRQGYEPDDICELLGLESTNDDFDDLQGFKEFKAVEQKKSTYGFKILCTLLLNEQ